MQNHYEILGVPASASQREIRRAYRILARRYHPDVNPEHAGGEKFKAISEAYTVLSDSSSRARYDADLAATSQQNQFKKYKAYTDQATNEFRARARHAAAEAARKARTANPDQGSAHQRRPADPGTSPEFDALNKLKEKISRFDSQSALAQLKKGFKSIFYVDTPQKSGPSSSERSRTSSATGMNAETAVSSVSIIEVSITMQEAISGVRKTIEIQEQKGFRKVSVQIPAGSRNGSLVRLRNKQQSQEELVLIMRVAPHPFLHIDSRGLIVEVPVSLKESIFGGSITVPGIEEEHIIRVPSGSQSGTEVRLREKGIRGSRGVRGDIFYKLMIQVPDSIHAVGFKEAADTLEQYYAHKVRSGMPNRLLGS